MYWGSLMIGRWAGAVSAFKLSDNSKLLLQIIVPLIAFGIIVGVNTVAQYDMKPLYYYVVCVLIQIAAFYVSKNKPARTLLIFSLLAHTFKHTYAAVYCLDEQTIDLFIYYI